MKLTIYEKKTMILADILSPCILLRDIISAEILRYEKIIHNCIWK